MDSHNYITGDDFLLDVRNLTSVLGPYPSAPVDSITAGELSMNPQVTELRDRISDITRRAVLQEGGVGLPQEAVPSKGLSLDGTMPRGAPLEYVLLKQPVSPEGAPFKVSSAGTSPLQQ